MKQKRLATWVLGTIAVSALIVYGIYVRILIGEDPLTVLSRMQVGSPVTEWTCKQVLHYASFSAEDVADLNRSGGALYPILIKDIGLAEEMLGLFLARGVDVNAGNVQERNWTALNSMVIDGDVARVKLLIKYGARSNVRDTADKSPLDYARAWQEKYPNDPNRAEVLRLLKEADTQSPQR